MADDATGHGGTPDARPVWLVPVVVLVLLVAVAGSLVAFRATRPTSLDLGAAVTKPPPSAGADDGGLEAGAATLLARIQSVLGTGDRAALLDLARQDSRSERVLGAWSDNVTALGLTDVALRYVDEQTSGVDSWTADVEVRYRDPRSGGRAVLLDGAVTFARSPRGVVVTGAGGDGGRTPLWMLEPLDVRRAGVVTAAVSEGSEPVSPGAC